MLRGDLLRPSFDVPRSIAGYYRLVGRQWSGYTERVVAIVNGLSATRDSIAAATVAAGCDASSIEKRTLLTPSRH